VTVDRKQAFESRNDRFKVSWPPILAASYNEVTRAIKFWAASRRTTAGADHDYSGRILNPRD
jgi:hypothetical protein